MLAEKRILKFEDNITFETPLLVPSFSSKGFPGIQKLMKIVEEYITGPILVSAYDVHHNNFEVPITFPEMIFLDSGGYECSKDFSLSEIYYSFVKTNSPSKPKKSEQDEWTISDFHKVLNRWPKDIPTVVVSYDHPKIRVPISKQISSAKTFFNRRDYFLSDILIKPETQNQNYIQIKSVLKHIHLLKYFDIIAFTEKELGNSILARMTNIARVRIEMNNHEINAPIHIFGSLDPISTPLYFISGADIFDGLTWLRFSYYKRTAIYQHNYSAIKLGIDLHDRKVKARAWVDNIHFLNNLKWQMRKYLTNRDFKKFKLNSDFIEESYEALQTKFKGEV